MAAILFPLLPQLKTTEQKLLKKNFTKKTTQCQKKELLKHWDEREVMGLLEEHPARNV
jgi:hypothetical protein